MTTTRNPIGEKCVATAFPWRHTGLPHSWIRLYETASIAWMSWIPVRTTTDTPLFFFLETIPILHSAHKRRKEYFFFKRHTRTIVSVARDVVCASVYGRRAQPNRPRDTPPITLLVTIFHLSSIYLLPTYSYVTFLKFLFLVFIPSCLFYAPINHTYTHIFTFRISCPPDIIRNNIQ